MEVKDQVITDFPMVKRINKYLHTSEYTTSEYSVRNIIVNQCPELIQILLQTIFDDLVTDDYKIAYQFLFGSSEHEKENKILAETYFGGITWPVSVIKQDKIHDKSNWGTVITAIKTKSLSQIYDGETIIGNSFYDEHASHCFLAGVLPQVIKESNKSQTILTLEKIDRAVKYVDMNFNDVVRTWFYLNDLLSWYDDFNSLNHSDLSSGLPRIIISSGG